MYHVDFLLIVYAGALIFSIAAVVFLRSWIVELQEKVSLLSDSVHRLYNPPVIVEKVPAVIRKPRATRKPRDTRTPRG